ncbi:MAG: hypothetical protein V3U71_12930 [Cocleimonas sp.]
MIKIHHTVLISTLLLSSCTLNEGDPQVTLCQLLATHINQSATVEWDKASKVQLKDKSMKVAIKSSNSSPTKIQGSCIYLSDADDAGKDYDVNILDSYQNIPSTIVINNHKIPSSILHQAIQSVTGESVKDTLNKIK